MKSTPGVDVSWDVQVEVCSLTGGSPLSIIGGILLYALVLSSVALESCSV